VVQSTVTETPVRHRRSWHRADTAALAVGGLGLLLIALVGRAAFLRGDDWVLLSVVSQPDFAAWEIFRPYGAHLMPFGLGCFWALRGLFGATPWWPLVGVGLVFVATALTCVWLTIRLLVGPRLSAVVPFAVACWGPAGLAAVMWPSPSVYMTPLWAVTAAAVYVYVRGRLLGSRGWQVWVLVIFAVGLLVIQTALLTAPLLFLIAASWFARGGVQSSLRQAWHSSRYLWLALFGMTGLYVAAYSLLSKFAQGLPSERAGVDLLIEGSIQVAWKVLPSLLLAGPWVWDSAVAPRIATGGALAAVAAVLAWVVIWRSRRSGWRAWFPVFTLFAMTLLALSAARVAVYGSTVLLNPYYFIQASGLLAVTLAVGYLPNRLPIDREQAEPGVWAMRSALALVAVSAVVSALGYARNVPALPERSYLSSARASLTQPTMNTAAPRDSFGVFWYLPPFDTAEHTLAFAGVQGNWVAVTADPFMLAADGSRVPLQVEGLPVEFPVECLRIEAPTALGLPQRRDPNWSVYELQYRADQATVAVIELGETVLEVPMTAGDGTVFLAGPARQGTLDIRAEGVCVRSVEVGPAVPVG